MSEKVITTEAFRCNYCHQKTYMEVVGSMPQKFGDSDSEGWARPDFVGWEALQCPNCDEISIWYGAADSDGESYSNSEIIYPQPIEFKAPDQIGFQFRAAIKAMHSSPAGAVNQFRVILEMIWDDHEPVSGTKPKKPKNFRDNSKNKGMLRQLFDGGVLPGEYAEMADELANVCNKASHDDATVEIDYDDAKRAMHLTKAILDHVYRVRPAGLKYLRQLETKVPRSNSYLSGNYWYSKSTK